MDDNMSRVEGILLGDSTVAPLSRVEVLLINLLGNIIGEQEVRSIVSEAIAEVIDSSADAFDILNDLENWLETHEEAFASITESIASSYDSTHVYSEGDYCTHNYKLYKCIYTMSQAEAWTDAHWSQVNVIEELKNSITSESIAPEFSASASYTAGQYVYKNGVLYRFKSNHSGAWSGTDAETVTVGGEVEEAKSATDYASSSLGFEKDESNTFTFTNGKAITYSSGGTSTSAILSYSNFVKIPDGSDSVKLSMIVRASDYNTGMAFYSSASESAYISGVENKTDSSLTTLISEIENIPVPDGAKYIRTTWIATTHQAYTLNTFSCVFCKSNLLKNEVEKITHDTINATAFPMSVKWYRQTGTAAGAFSTGNGATSELISIDAINNVSITNAARFSCFFYKAGNYFGKLNAEYGVDKVSGSWGFFTDCIVNVAEIMRTNGCDSVRISILPLTSLTLTDATVETFANSVCGINRLFLDSDNNIMSQKTATWKRGTYAADGMTFSNASNTAITGFIENVKAVVASQQTRVEVFFYSDLKPVGKIGKDYSINQLTSNWGYVYRVFDIAKYVTDHNVAADSVKILIEPLDGTTISSDADANTFANANCKIFVSTYATAPTFNSAMKINTSFVRSVNHRGFNRFAPENTLPAYAMSKKAGYDAIEADIDFTYNNVPVMLHDSTINRTGRNADGSTISSTININSITYAQALEYDFGIWMGSEYAGTKIPTFDETILLCKQLGLDLYLDIKSALDDTQVDIISDSIEAVGMDGHVIFMHTDLATLQKFSVRFPKATLLKGITTYTESALTTLISEINSLKNGENIVLTSGSVINMTSALYDQLSDAGISSIAWTNIGGKFTVPLNKNVIAAFVDYQDIGAETIDYVFNQLGV